MTDTNHTKPATAHTPGPWHYQLYADRQTRLVGPKGWHILSGTFTGEAAEANARLVAATPAQSILLDLLQYGLATVAEGELEFDGVMYWFDYRCPDWAARVVDAIGWDHARTALANAKGGDQ
jgi:hypothetical protein